MNMQEFADKVIGVKMEIYHSIDDDSELNKEPFEIDTVDEQDDGTWDVTSVEGTTINIPTLEDIEKAVDGSAYYLVNTTGYSKIFRRATKTHVFGKY